MTGKKYAEVLEAAYRSDVPGQAFSDHQITVEVTDKGAVHIVYTGSNYDDVCELVDYCRDEGYPGVVAKNTNSTTWEIWFSRA